jgi:deuterolysin
VRISGDNLNVDSFISIKKKKSVDVSFNLADMYDIGNGGQFTLIAEGGIPWAKKKSTSILGTVPFKSNKITIKVDKSSAVPPARNIMQSDCTAGRLEASKSANNVCSFMAMGAGLAALHGDPDQ